MAKTRAKDWLKQAQDDLAWAELGFKSGFYSQVCFMSQQSAEKAIKAIALFDDYEIRSHSIVAIARELKINSEVESAGRRLDVYYISSRYPDALPAGAPCEVLGKDQAQDALKDAKVILEKASARLKGQK